MSKIGRAAKVIESLLRGQRVGRRQLIAAHADLVGRPLNIKMPTTRDAEALAIIGKLEAEGGEPPLLTVAAKRFGRAPSSMTIHTTRLRDLGLLELVVPSAKAQRNQRLTKRGWRFLEARAKYRETACETMNRILRSEKKRKATQAEEGRESDAT